MTKRIPSATKQLNLFAPTQQPAAPPPPIPAPPRISATVTEQLPDDLIAAGYKRSDRIVWRTEKYNDGWFSAVNDRLGQQTNDHIYVKHRGFKYALRDIEKGRTHPIQA